MRKLTLSLLILIIATWAAIAVYWIGTEKNNQTPPENIETIVTLSPTTMLLATDSAGIATMSSTVSGILITSPTITVKY